MKTNNSILMGMKKTSLTNFRMKLLFIPCLIMMLFLSSFKAEGTRQQSVNSFDKNNVPAFTDPWVQTTFAWVFTDLDGVEYQDVWVEFFDEFYNYVTVYGITLNYRLEVSNPYSSFDMYQVLSGNSTFLLEDNAYYFVPNQHPVGSGRSYYYSVLPGTGYTLP